MLGALVLGSWGCAAQAPVFSHPVHDDRLVEDSSRHASGMALPPAEGDPRSPWMEEGLASWYGAKFHGRRTASGERYNMREFSAAHRTLPFGTLLEVTNLNNGNQVQVRVNDRGPFAEDRILDVSLAAARELDFVGDGVAPVRLVVLSGGDGLHEGFENAEEIPESGEAAAGSIVVGRCDSWWKAERLRHFLKGRFATIRIEGTEGDYRVVIGPFASEKLRQSVARRLSLEGYEVEAD